MAKLIRFGVLLIVAAVSSPRVAFADLTNRELRQTVRAAEYWLTVDFPLSAAIECDEQRQRHGATGTWDVDSRCNVELERIAALISLITGGSFVPADFVTAWCSAAEIVNSAKEIVENLRRGPDMSDEARNVRGWEAMPTYQQNAFMALNSTIGFMMVWMGSEE
jgi:hypothetical protein